jgi:hypothetical protein
MNQFKFIVFAAIIKVALSGGPSSTSCGVWASYDPKVNLGAPSSSGISAGAFKDGSAAYVGRGFGVVLRIKDEQPGAGVYYSSSSNLDTELFAETGAEYLVDTGAYQWVPNNAAANYPGAIGIIHPTYGFQPAARTNIDGYYVIGQVDVTYNTIYYPREQADGTFNVQNSTQFDVLVCLG